MSNKILIIDDDIQIGNLEQEVLEKRGFSCVRAYSGTEALMVLEREVPNLIILDLMLPGLTGEQILPKLKGIPVIVVSAKIDIDDKVKLLMDGAQDYITKPFDTKELVARVEVQLRKSNTVSNTRITFDDLEIDEGKHLVTAAGKEVVLTKTEFAILKQLVQKPDRVIAKAILLENLSEDTPDCTESSLKTHMSHLRSKLKEAGGKDYIDAVWGIGFKMKEKS